MSGLTSEILIRLRPLLRAGSLSATGSSRSILAANGSFIKQDSVVSRGLKADLTAKRLFCTTRSQSSQEEKLEKPKGVGSSRGGITKKEAGKGKGPVTWLSLSVTVFVMLASWFAFEYAKAKKQARMDKERRREIGKSKIGGSFELVDQDGNTKKSSDFHGKWLLLYFGFTHCPDICPDEMEKLALVYDELTKAANEKSAPNVTEPVPLFITVDPERDGVKEVREYIKEFHPKFVGLTGSAEKIKEACKAFRVYFSAGPKSEDDDYIVDHTIIIYLIDPEGNFIDYYGQNKTAQEIVASTIIQMNKYEAANQQSFMKSLVS